ncbi:MAG: DUF1772 domain-containing protein [Pseudomonadota bacterium]|nr:DUF1772 domain-containing protein [Pseudomonadota bacterium]
MLIALFALVAAALFAGAALYISVAEHPARMQLDDRGALAQWKPSYARAVPMQAGLALVSLLLGLWSWWKTDDGWVLLAALLIGANLPLTLIAIMPTNRRLQATAPDAAGPESRTLLARWGRLHGLRTLLAFAAIAAYLAAFAWP